MLYAEETQLDYGIVRPIQENLLEAAACITARSVKNGKADIIFVRTLGEKALHLRQ